MSEPQLAVQDTAQERDTPLMAEQRSWALLGAAALAIAGLFAALLALSRTPGIERLVTLPLDFFAKGLVIHVVFSLVIWFLTVFALLTTQATRELGGANVRLAGLGRIGLALVAMSFPMLFVPAFYHDTAATLNNYIPVIIHRYYYAGLVVLAAGILLPVVRLAANSGGKLRGHDVLPFAMLIGGLIYCVALVVFAVGVRGVWGEAPSRPMHEQLFWGGGHILQFLYCLLMLTGWTLLARVSFGRDMVDRDIFRLAATLVGVFACAGLLFCLAFTTFSPKYMEGFRRLQFVLGFPSLLIAVGGFSAIRKQQATQPLPWHTPAFLALVLSVAVFTLGGIMGLMVTGADTRTPAHYHAVIGGVQLASMGLMLAVALPDMLRAAGPAGRQRLQLALYAAGQVLASLGLFMAGGYGAPRKTPSGAADLTSGATIGMGLHGIGALLAVAGGILFVLTLLKALLRPAPQGSRTAPNANGK